MPQEPKRRHSRERKGKRRAGIKLEILKTIFCPNCKNIILPHTICKFCGFYKGTLKASPKSDFSSSAYRGREVLTLKPKADKKTDEKSS